MMKIFRLTAIFLLFVPAFVGAEEEIKFSVSQTIFNLNLQPGQTEELKLKIKNLSAEEKRFSLEKSDFVFGQNNQVEKLVGRNEIFGLADWLFPQEEVWLAKSNEEKELVMELKVPSEATVGSHYSLFSIQALPLVAGDNFQRPLVGGQIGIYVFVNVAGKISGRGKLDSFEAPWVVDDEEEFKVGFKNLGNIHYIPHGGVEVVNLFTRKKQDEKMEKHFVFPGKTYFFEKKWKVPSVFGIYTAKAYFIDDEGNYLSQKRLLLGKYFPWLVFLFLLFPVSFFCYRRKKKKRAVKESEKKEEKKIAKLATLLFLFGGLFFPFFSWAGEMEWAQADVFPESIQVLWKKPVLAITESVVVVKEQDRCPRFPWEGEEVYRGNGSELIDREVSNGKDYCYGVFTVDASGRQSRMVTTGLIRKISWWRFLFQLAGENFIIVFGPMVIVLLTWWDVRQRKIKSHQLNLGTTNFSKNASNKFRQW